MKVIVDGYNLLRRIPALAAMEKGAGGLEAARNELLRRLAGYHHLSGNAVTVVFDGQSVGAVTRFDRRSGVTVLYSRQGETADTVIAGQAAREPGSTVVSSDREVQAAARAARCDTIDVDRFWQVVSDVALRPQPPRSPAGAIPGGADGVLGRGAGGRASEGATGRPAGEEIAGSKAKKGNAHRRSKAERRREAEQSLLERRLRGR